MTFSIFNQKTPLKTLLFQSIFNAFETGRSVLLRLTFGFQDTSNSYGGGSTAEPRVTMSGLDVLNMVYTVFENVTIIVCRALIMLFQIQVTITLTSA